MSNIRKGDKHRDPRKENAMDKSKLFNLYLIIQQEQKYEY
jgi:hypothetical protein